MGQEGSWGGASQRGGSMDFSISDKKELYSKEHYYHLLMFKELWPTYWTLHILSLPIQALDVRVSSVRYYHSTHAVNSYTTWQGDVAMVTVHILAHQCEHHHTVVTLRGDIMLESSLEPTKEGFGIYYKFSFGSLYCLGLRVRVLIKTCNFPRLRSLTHCA